MTEKTKNTLVFGFAEDDPELYLKGTARGRLNLPLSTFKPDRGSYGLEGIGAITTGEYLDLSQYHVLEVREGKWIVGERPSEFTVFDSREAHAEIREAHQEDAYFKANKTLEHLLTIEAPSQATAALIDRKWEGYGVRDTIHYLTNLAQ